MSAEVKAHLGAKFISESCILLGLSHEARYKALVLFHYFADKIEFTALCTASLLLASKLEEEMCTLKRILYVFNYLYTEYQSEPRALTYRHSIRIKESCIQAETEMLKSLGFNPNFIDIYGELLDALEDLELDQKLAQRLFLNLNAFLACPKILNTTSKALLTSVIEAAYGGRNELTEFAESCVKHEGKKYDLETFTEIPSTRKIDASLVSGFIKRQKKI
jgi:hypothetical protein